MDFNCRFKKLTTRIKSKDHFSDKKNCEKIRRLKKFDCNFKSFIIKSANP